MTPEQRQVLVSMKDNQYGDALRALLSDCLEELGDVEKCESWEDTLGRKHAKSFLKKTFTFLYKSDSDKGGRNQYT
jgi:hypothetical protein